MFYSRCDDLLYLGPRGFIGVPPPGPSLELPVGPKSDLGSYLSVLKPTLGGYIVLRSRVVPVPKSRSLIRTRIDRQSLLQRVKPLVDA